jgi:hypothetical protein
VFFSLLPFFASSLPLFLIPLLPTDPFGNYRGRMMVTIHPYQ